MLSNIVKIGIGTILGAILVKENKDEVLRLLIGEKPLESFIQQEEVENFSDGRDTIPDVPVSFDSKRRLFTLRRVKTIQAKPSDVD